MSNVKVAVRIRPLNGKEIAKDAKVIVETSRDNNGDIVQVYNPKLEGQAEIVDSRERAKAFLFDYVYLSIDPTKPNYASQQLIFQDLGTDVLQQAFEGFNGCVFAYGQTGSGKTYTMMGDPPEVGLIPRICEGLFNRVHDTVEEVGAEERVTFKISVSYMEIYNERVRDLLPSPSSKGERYTLKVREHPKDGPFVEGLRKHSVKDNVAVQTLIRKGNENRTTAATHFHDRSSRSHAIFTLNFTQAKFDQQSQMPYEIVSKIHLVDLAGSERADPHHKYNKGILTEASNINKSLVTLGNVIVALAERSLQQWSNSTSGDNLTGSTIDISVQSPGGSTEQLNTSGQGTPQKRTGQRKFFIPYRDSVLTWLLKDSLGGNAKTIMIATIAPTSLYYGETLSTLRYAQRAKNIVNKPVVNEDANAKTIRELRQEVERLQHLLAAKWASGSVSSISETSSYIQDRMEEHKYKAQELTKSWMYKWQETQEIMKESDMSIQPVRLGRRSNSMGVIVDSHLPHLIDLSDNLLSTGVLMYHLKEGKTFIGSEEATRDLEIYLQGDDVLPEHCVIRHVNGEVTLHPTRGAYVTVNDKKISSPVKLSQGDIIFLGKYNMFRFNNPVEVAKLREQGKGQGGEGRLRSSLSRCSSSSSIGTQASSMDCESPASPLSPALNKSVDMERSEQNELDKIANARKELEKLQAQQQKAWDLRMEKEDELFQRHEQQKRELEEEKARLREKIAQYEEERAQAELELEEQRRQLQEDHENAEARIAEETARLALLEKQHKEAITAATQQFAIATMSDVGSLAMETESQLADLSGGGRDRAATESQTTIEQQRLKIEAQKAELGAVKRRLEEELSDKQRELDDMFTASSDKLELQRRLLADKEKTYKEENKTVMESVAMQTDYIEQLEHKQVQLVQYIEAKQLDLMPEAERETPIGASHSEESFVASGTGRGRPRMHTRSYTEPSTSSRWTDSTAGAAILPSKPPLPPQKDSTRGGAKPKTRSTAEEVTNRLYPGPKMRADAASIRSKRAADSNLQAKSKSVPILRGAGKRLKQLLPGLKKSSSQLGSNSSLPSVPETADEDLARSPRTHRKKEAAHGQTFFDTIENEPVRLRTRNKNQAGRPHSWAAPDKRQAAKLAMETESVDTGHVITGADSAMDAANSDFLLSPTSHTSGEEFGYDHMDFDPHVIDRESPDGREKSEVPYRSASSSPSSNLPSIVVAGVDKVSVEFHAQAGTVYDTAPVTAVSTPSPFQHEQDPTGRTSDPQKSSSAGRRLPGKSSTDKLSSSVTKKKQTDDKPVSSSRDNRAPKKSKAESSISQDVDTSPRAARRGDSSRSGSRGRVKPPDHASPGAPQSQGPKLAPGPKSGSKVSPDGSPNMATHSQDSKSKTDEEAKSNLKRTHSKTSKDSPRKEFVKPTKQPKTDEVPVEFYLLSSSTEMLSSPQSPREGEGQAEDVFVDEDGTKYIRRLKPPQDDMEALMRENEQYVLVSKLPDGRTQSLGNDPDSPSPSADEQQMDEQQGDDVDGFKLRMLHPKNIIKFMTGCTTGIPDEEISRFNGLSTQELHTEYQNAIREQLAREERHKEWKIAQKEKQRQWEKELFDGRTTQDLQHEYLQQVKQQLERDDGERFSDDSLDGAELAAAGAGVPPKKPPRAHSEADALRPQPRTAQRTGSAGTGVNLAQSAPVNAPGLRAGLDALKMPSISLPQAMLKSANLTIPYYFKRGSKSDSELPHLAREQELDTRLSSGSSQATSHPVLADGQDTAGNGPAVEEQAQNSEQGGRKPSKHRVRRRQVEQPTESESGQQTDDSLQSGRSKPSSRPGSSTRRRRRQPRAATEADLSGQKRLKVALSSEEYATSEEDSIFSEDSLVSEERVHGDTDDVDVQEVPVNEVRRVTDVLDSMTSALVGASDSEVVSGSRHPVADPESIQQQSDSFHTSANITVQNSTGQKTPDETNAMGIESKVVPELSKDTQTRSSGATNSVQAPSASSSKSTHLQTANQSDTDSARDSETTDRPPQERSSGSYSGGKDGGGGREESSADIMESEPMQQALHTIGGVSTEDESRAPPLPTLKSSPHLLFSKIQIWDNSHSMLDTKSDYGPSQPSSDVAEGKEGKRLPSDQSKNTDSVDTLSQSVSSHPSPPSPVSDQSCTVSAVSTDSKRDSNTWQGVFKTAVSSKPIQEQSTKVSVIAKQQHLTKTVTEKWSVEGGRQLEKPEAVQDGTISEICGRSGQKTNKPSTHSKPVHAVSDSDTPLSCVALVSEPPVSTDVGNDVVVTLAGGISLPQSQISVDADETKTSRDKERDSGFYGKSSDGHQTDSECRSASEAEIETLEPSVTTPDENESTGVCPAPSSAELPAAAGGGEESADSRRNTGSESATRSGHALTSLTERSGLHDTVVGNSIKTNNQSDELSKDPESSDDDSTNMLQKKDDSLSDISGCHDVSADASTGEEATSDEPMEVSSQQDDTDASLTTVSMDHTETASWPEVSDTHTSEQVSSAVLGEQRADDTQTTDAWPEQDSSLRDAPDIQTEAVELGEPCAPCYSHAVCSDSDPTSPRSDVVHSGSDPTSPQSDTVHSDSDPKSPRSDTVHSDSDPTSPQSETVHSNSDPKSPRSDAVHNDIDPTSPGSDVVHSDSDPTSPRSDTVYSDSDQGFDVLEGRHTRSDPPPHPEGASPGRSFHPDTSDSDSDSAGDKGHGSAGVNRKQTGRDNTSLNESIPADDSLQSIIVSQGPSDGNNKPVVSVSAESGAESRSALQAASERGASPDGCPEQWPTSEQAAATASKHSSRDSGIDESGRLQHVSASDKEAIETDGTADAKPANGQPLTSPEGLQPEAESALATAHRGAQSIPPDPAYAFPECDQLEGSEQLAVSRPVLVGPEDVFGCTEDRLAATEDDISTIVSETAELESEGTLEKESVGELETREITEEETESEKQTCYPESNVSLPETSELQQDQTIYPELKVSLPESSDSQEDHKNHNESNVSMTSASDLQQDRASCLESNVSMPETGVLQEDQTRHPEPDISVAKTSGLQQDQISDLDSDVQVPGTSDLQQEQTSSLDSDVQIPGTSDLRQDHTNYLDSDVQVRETSDMQQDQTSYLDSDVQVPGTSDLQKDHTSDLDPDVQVPGTRDLQQDQTSYLDSDVQVPGTSDLQQDHTSDLDSYVQVPETSDMPQDQTSYLDSDVQVPGTSDLPQDQTSYLDSDVQVPGTSDLQQDQPSYLDSDVHVPGTSDLQQDHTSDLDSDVQVRETSDMQQNQTSYLDSDVQVPGTSDLPQDQTSNLDSDVQVRETSNMQQDQTSYLDSGVQVPETSDLQQDQTSYLDSDVQVPGTSDLQQGQTSHLDSDVQVPGTSDLPQDQTSNLDSDVQVRETSNMQQDQTSYLDSGVQVPETSDLQQDQTSYLDSDVQVPGTSDLQQDQTSHLDSNVQVPGTSDMQQDHTSFLDSGVQVPGTSDLQHDQTSYLDSDVQVPGTSDLQQDHTSDLDSDMHVPGTSDLQQDQTSYLDSDVPVPGTSDLQQDQTSYLDSDVQVPGISDLQQDQTSYLDSDVPVPGTSDLQQDQTSSLSPDVQVQGISDLQQNQTSYLDSDLQVPGSSDLQQESALPVQQAVAYQDSEPCSLGDRHESDECINENLLASLIVNRERTEQNRRLEYAPGEGIESQCQKPVNANSLPDKNDITKEGSQTNYADNNQHGEMSIQKEDTGNTSANTKPLPSGNMDSVPDIDISLNGSDPNENSESIAEGIQTEFISIVGGEDPGKLHADRLLSDPSVSGQLSNSLNNAKGNNVISVLLESKSGICEDKELLSPDRKSEKGVNSAGGQSIETSVSEHGSSITTDQGIDQSAACSNVHDINNRQEEIRAYSNSYARSALSVNVESNQSCNNDSVDTVCNRTEEDLNSGGEEDKSQEVSEVAPQHDTSISHIQSISNNKTRHDRAEITAISDNQIKEESIYSPGDLSSAKQGKLLVESSSNSSTAAAGRHAQASPGSAPGEVCAQSAVQKSDKYKQTQSSEENSSEQDCVISRDCGVNNVDRECQQDLDTGQNTDSKLDRIATGYDENERYSQCEDIVRTDRKSLQDVCETSPEYSQSPSFHSTEPSESLTSTNKVTGVNANKTSIPGSKEYETCKEAVTDRVDSAKGQRKSQIELIEGVPRIAQDNLTTADKGETKEETGAALCKQRAESECLQGQVRVRADSDNEMDIRDAEACLDSNMNSSVKVTDSAQSADDNVLVVSGDDNNNMAPVSSAPYLTASPPEGVVPTAQDAQTRHVDAARGVDSTTLMDDSLNKNVARAAPPGTDTTTTERESQNLHAASSESGEGGAREGDATAKRGPSAQGITRSADATSAPLGHAGARPREHKPASQADHGACGSAAQNQRRPDPYTDTAQPQSVDTSFDEGYHSVLISSPRSDYVDDYIRGLNTSSRTMSDSEQLLDTSNVDSCEGEQYANGGAPVPPLDLSEITGDSRDSTPRAVHQRRVQGNTRPEMESESRFVEVMDTTEPRNNALGQESSRFISLSSSQSSLPHDDSNEHARNVELGEQDNNKEMDDYSEQHSTPPVSPTNTPPRSPSITPREKFKSESDLHDGEQSQALGACSNASANSLSKSDLHLQPACDEDRELFESKEEIEESQQTNQDPGTFQIVHFKAPEPKPKRKKKSKRNKADRARQLVASDMAVLRNDDIDQLEEQLAEQGTEYTTVRSSDVPAPADVTSPRTDSALPRNASLLVNVGEDDIETLTDDEVRMIREQTRGVQQEELPVDVSPSDNRDKLPDAAGDAPSIPKRPSMIVNYDNRDVDDVTEEDIELLSNQKPQQAAESRQIVIPPKPKRLKKSDSVVVNVDDKDLDNITEEEVQLLTDPVSDRDIEPDDVRNATEVTSDDLDRFRARQAVLPKPASLVVNFEPSDLEELSEDEVRAVEGERKVTRDTLLKPTEIQKQPSVEAQMGEQGVEEISEEDIAFMTQAHEAKDEHSKRRVDGAKVSFLIGDEQVDAQAGIVDREPDLQKMIEAMSRERGALQGAQEPTVAQPLQVDISSTNLPKAERAVKQESTEERSDRTPQSDSAFSSDYTDHTQSDFTDSETTFSPQSSHDKREHRLKPTSEVSEHEATVAPTAADDVQPAEALKNGKVDPDQRFKDSGNVCDEGDDAVRTVMLGESGKADSIEEIHQIPGSVISGEEANRKQKPVSFTDTKVIGFDVQPRRGARPASPDHSPLDGHDVVIASSRTRSYSADEQRARLSSDVHILGLQPPHITAPLPDNVLREDSVQPFHSQFVRAALNIEVQPWHGARDSEQAASGYTTMTCEDDEMAEMTQKVAEATSKKAKVKVLLTEGSDKEATSSEPCEGDSEVAEITNDNRVLAPVSGDTSGAVSSEEEKYRSDSATSMDTVIETAPRQRTNLDRVLEGESHNVDDSDTETLSSGDASEVEVDGEGRQGKQAVKASINVRIPSKRTPVESALSVEQKLIGHMTASERELLGSGNQLFEGLVPSFRDLPQATSNDESEPCDVTFHGKTRSMELPHGSDGLTDETPNEGEPSTNDQFRNQMNMFKKAGRMMFANETEPTQIRTDVEIVESDEEDGRFRSGEAMASDSDECHAQQEGSSESLSPGELCVHPLSLDTLASLSSDGLDDPEEQFDQMRWVELVSDMPDVVTSDVEELRESWMSRFYRWYTRSLSMSELEVLDRRDWYDGRSFSADCLNLITPGAPRAVSTDSITYVFLNEARSLDMLGNGQNPPAQMVGAKSEPSCAEKELRHKYGIDDTLLPFKVDRASSLEILDDSMAQDRMSTRQRSQSIDENKWLSGEVSRSPDLTPETVFGGPNPGCNEGDYKETLTQGSVKPRVRSAVQNGHITVRPIPNDEPVRLRRRRPGKDGNKRVSWGDVEEKLTYVGSPVDASFPVPEDQVTLKTESVDMGTQTSDFTEQMENHGMFRVIRDAVIREESETQTPSDETTSSVTVSSQTDGDTVQPNQPKVSKEEVTGSKLSLSSDVTDAQTSPIPFDLMPSEATIAEVEEDIISPRSPRSRPSALIQHALATLRDAMGSETEVGVIDNAVPAPGTPIRVTHLSNTETQTPLASSTPHRSMDEDDIFNKSNEGPLSVSSPNEASIPDSTVSPPANSQSSRQILAGSEVYVNEDMMYTQDMSHPLAERGRSSVIQPSLREESVQMGTISSNRPPQPVGRAEPLRGQSEYFSTETQRLQEQVYDHKLMLEAREQMIRDEQIQARNLQELSREEQMRRNFRDDIMRRSLRDYQPYDNATADWNLPQRFMDYPRTIETQTDILQRVMETQTYPELRVIETQTSPRYISEAEYTQTELLEYMTMAVQTDNEYDLAVSPRQGRALLIDAGCNPSPPRGFSPLSWAVQTDVSMFERYPDSYCQTDPLPEPEIPEPQIIIQREVVHVPQETEPARHADMVAVACQTDEDDRPLQTLAVFDDRTPSISSNEDLSDILSLSDDDDQVNIASAGGSIPSEHEAQVNEGPITASPLTSEAPMYSLDGPGLASLREEHEKLMALFSKSASDRTMSIKKRHELKEKRNKEVLTEMDHVSLSSLNSSMAGESAETSSQYMAEAETSATENASPRCSGNSSGSEEDPETPRNQLEPAGSAPGAGTGVELPAAEGQPKQALVESMQQLNEHIQQMRTSSSAAAEQLTHVSHLAASQETLSDGSQSPRLTEESQEDIEAAVTAHDEPDTARGEIDEEQEHRDMGEIIAEKSVERGTSGKPDSVQTVAGLTMSDPYHFEIVETLPDEVEDRPDVGTVTAIHGKDSQSPAGHQSVRSPESSVNVVESYRGTDTSDCDEILLVPKEAADAMDTSASDTENLRKLRFEKIEISTESQKQKVSQQAESLSLEAENVGSQHQVVATVETHQASVTTAQDTFRQDQEISVTSAPTSFSVTVTESANENDNQVSEVHRVTPALATKLPGAREQLTVVPVEDRPPSRVASTQYQEDDFVRIIAPRARPQDQTDSSSCQAEALATATAQAAAVSQTAEISTSAQSKPQSQDIRSIIEKYQTIKKLVENEDFSTALVGAPVNVQTNDSAETANSSGNRNRYDSAGKDVSFDVSIDTSFTDSEMKDESIETDFHSDEISDELERLRRERQRIVDMLAKESMPSKLQVELAEAQLNYIIGQTDTLLTTIDEPLMEWNMESLAQFSSYPEEELGELSRQYLTHYRRTLEKSKVHIESKIEQLEREKEKSSRARSREKQFAKMRREAQIEAFKIERQREQNKIGTTTGKPPRSPRSPRSQSASPRRKPPGIVTERPPPSPISPLSPRNPLPPISAKFLTPKQRIQHLANLRKGIVKYTDEERSRSLSPALSTTSSASSVTRSSSFGRTVSGYSPYRSTYLAQRDPEVAYRSGESYRHTSYSQSPRRSAVSSHYDAQTHRGYSLYGDAETVSIGSLDEDSERLLDDAKQVQSRTREEIKKAREVLDKKSPVTSPRELYLPGASPRGASSSVNFSSSVYPTSTRYGSIHESSRGTLDGDRRAKERIDRIEKRDTRPAGHALSTGSGRNVSDQQIDYEIEELKKKYGMMSQAAQSTPSSHVTSVMDRYTGRGSVLTGSSAHSAYSFALYPPSPSLSRRGVGATTPSSGPFSRAASSAFRPASHTRTSNIRGTTEPAKTGEPSLDDK